MFATDLDSTDNPIWYRATNDTTILKQADADIRRLSKDNFTSKYALIITYDNVPIRRSPRVNQTFQAVLVSDFKLTYVIMNYVNLTVNGTTGFYENEFHFKIFLEGDSRALAETSNIGIKGTHVHLLTLVNEGNAFYFLLLNFPIIYFILQNLF